MADVLGLFIMPLIILHLSILVTWLIPKDFYIDCAVTRLTSRLLKYSLFNPLQAFRAGEEFRQKLEKNYYKDLLCFSIIFSISSFALCGILYFLIKRGAKWLMF